MRFVIETKRSCRSCKREVDAVRVVDDPDDALPGLRVSRHFRPSDDALAFCAGSLAAVSREVG